MRAFIWNLHILTEIAVKVQQRST